MRSAGISEIKKELHELEAAQLLQLCLSLAKYKKENKDYLNYLLFEAHDKEQFVLEVKQELEQEFEELKQQSNLYYVKKGLRRILRVLNRYIKYIDDKAAAADLTIYFCLLLKESGIPFRKNKLIVNLYEQQLKKINALVTALHEDLRADYQSDIAKLSLA